MRSESKDFAYHVTKFLTVYLPGYRNVAQGTITTYKDTFRLWLQFSNDILSITPSRLTLDDMSRKNIERFVLWLKETRHNSPTTCNQRLAALNSFFHYLQFEQPDRLFQCKQCMDIPYMKAQEPPLRYLSIEAIKVLLEQPNTSTKYGRRDLAILSVMYDTGARASEISGINVSDLRLISPATLTLHGKGGKVRIVPVLTGTSEILSQYLDDFKLRNQPDLPLFSNHQHRRISRFGIAHVLRTYATKARACRPDLIPDNVSPHVIRHSKAMHLLQANVNLIYIRDLLGHSDVKTTEIYARADNTLKREALEKANPIKHLSLDTPDWSNDESLMEWLRNLGK